MKQIFSAIIILLLPISMGAQESNIDELLNSEDIRLEDPIINDLLLMQQIQTDKEVNHLINVGQSGLNVSVINQNGRDNQADVRQNGQGHFTRLDQKGNNNKAFLSSSGEHTLQIVKQDGDGNAVESSINNQAVPNGTMLVQQGNDNSIMLRMDGSEAFKGTFPVAAIINQQGNELRVNATFDRYESPFYINQQSGPSGEGMQLNITTSDFYFPMK